MARLRTPCPDLQVFENQAAAFGGTGNAPTFDTGTVRNATRQRASIKCAVGANSGWSMVNWNCGLAAGNTGFDRFYARIPSSVGFPTGSGGTICQLTTAVNAMLLEIRVSSSGVATLWSQNVQVGTGTFQLALDTWHRFEPKLLVPASGNGTLALLIDGSTVVADTSVNVGTTAAPIVWLGPIGPNNANITNFTVNLIDIAFNDSTGAAQNSYPGAAIVGACLPISDNSRTGWTGGAAGTTSLFDAVNNTPPVGVALASATDLTQIKRLAANTTDNYVANLGAYTAALASGGAGLVAGDTVTVVQSVLTVGQSTSTTTSFGQTLTNPTVAETTASGPAAVAGVYPSNWVDVTGTVTYAPTVTLGSSPTLKVRKNTSSSSITQMVALMALIVESVPAPNLAISESITLTESLGRNFAPTRAVTNSITFSESIASTGGKARAISEGISLSESIGRTDAEPRNISDAITLTDSLTTVTAHPRVITGAIALSESIIGQTGNTRPLTDSLSLSDVITRGAFTPTRAVANTISLDDAITDTGAHTRAIADSITLTNVASSLTEKTRAITDSITLVGVLASSAGYPQDISNNVTMADTISWLGFSRTLDNSITLIDHLVAGTPFLRRGDQFTGFHEPVYVTNATSANYIVSYNDVIPTARNFREPVHSTGDTVPPYDVGYNDVIPTARNFREPVHSTGDTVPPYDVGYAEVNT